MSQSPSFNGAGILNPFASLFESLTNRECAILQLAARDLTCEEIAAQLGITKATVHKHRKNILKKSGYKGKTALQRLLRQLEVYFR